MQINMVKLKTLTCKSVYDPSENDNIAFEDLPEDYVCPLCGVGKEDFSPEE